MTKSLALLQNYHHSAEISRNNFDFVVSLAENEREA